MLDSIKSLFERSHPDDPAQQLRVAAAALLIEMARMDDVISMADRAAVIAALRSQFDLNDDEIKTLLDLAERAAREAIDYYHFTSLLNAHLDLAQKTALIENLWRVAYADGALDKYEDHLLHKLADLLYVPRDAVVAARRRAAN